MVLCDMAEERLSDIQERPAIQDDIAPYAGVLQGAWSKYTGAKHSQTLTLGQAIVIANDLGISLDELRLLDGSLRDIDTESLEEAMEARKKRRKAVKNQGTP